MNRDEMLEYMPHRGANVLIDSYEDTGETSGRGTLTIAEGDPDGRDIFLAREDGGLRYSSFFLVEHVALTSILILRADMGGGRLAYFSAISKFRSLGTAAAGTPLVSHVERGRDRREFRSFGARVETADGDPVLEVNFMAYLAARGARPDEGRSAPPAAEFGTPAADGFPCRPPRMVFVGGPDGAGRYGGVYPADHPLCAGHFPGAPVMMGMCQWLAVAQRAALEAPDGASEVTGDGRLVTADGRPVVEVAGLRLAVTKDAGRVTALRLRATRKVSFRDRILPGDAYLAECSGLETGC